MTCLQSRTGKLFSTEKIIACAHSRGRDELVHRGLKDFGSEELPFKKFASNAAYYYTIIRLGLTQFTITRLYNQGVLTPTIAMKVCITIVYTQKTHDSIR